MDWRRVAVFILINAIVSALVTLAVLSIWESGRQTSAPIPTSFPAAQATRLPDATPGITPTELPPSVPADTPTPSGPFVYTIEAGDTLGSLSLKFDVSLEDLLAANGLTEDAILSVDQEIIIPIGGSTDIASAPTVPSTTPVPTSANPALVVIREIESPGSAGAESVILTNLGGVINLAGWTLSDGADKRYTFPDVTLFANAEIRVFTRSGSNTPSDLYWGQSAAVWGATGTIAYLRDAGGKLVATYRVP